jgi:hypothetical protein
LLGVLALLGLYLTVFIFPLGNLPHVHHDHDAHAEDSGLEDACHIALYHPGSKNKCDHKAHFTQNHTDCPWCKIVPTRQTQPPAVEQVLVILDFSKSVSQHEADEIFTFSVSHRDRGPPGYAGS